MAKLDISLIHLGLSEQSFFMRFSFKPFYFGVTSMLFADERTRTSFKNKKQKFLIKTLKWLHEDKLNWEKAYNANLFIATNQV